jgi:AGCS family alanine or glycine:cation symporter
MAIPNLISLLLLSPLIVRLTREYFARREADAGATRPIAAPQER